MLTGAPSGPLLRASVFQSLLMDARLAVAVISASPKETRVSAAENRTAKEEMQLQQISSPTIKNKACFAS